MGVQRKTAKRKQYTPEFKREAVRLVTEGGFSPFSLLLLAYFRGRCQDVLNEVISDNDEQNLRPNPWLKICGESYIAATFHAAHQADGGATLIYNDYNIERGTKHQKALHFLRNLLNQGVPIHAVGIQGHWHLDFPNLETIETAIANFATLGLKVHITELDISVLPTKNQGADLDARRQLTPESNPFTQGLPAEVAAQQARRYEELFGLFLRYWDTVERVTLWGVHGGDSWLNNFPVRWRTDYPLLFDRDFAPKPGFFATFKAAQEAK